MQGAQQAGALTQQGVDAALAGSAQNIGAIQGAANTGLQGMLQGGALNLAGNQQSLGAIGQAANVGMSAEQLRGQNTQYGYGLTQAQTANMLQIAGMQADLNIQNAGMTNQMIGGAIGAAGSLMAMSDVNAKEDIVALSPGGENSGMAGMIGRGQAEAAARQNMIGGPRDFTGDNADPYGINFGADKDPKKKSFLQGIGGALGNFGGAMMGQPMMMSDERSKYAVSDEAAKKEAGKMVAGLDPYAFNYKDPERHGAGRHIGVMAQDLEKSPAGRTVVEEGPDGMKRVNTPKLTMLNSAALAQYDDRIGELEKRIASMGGRAA